MKNLVSALGPRDQSNECRDALASAKDGSLGSFHRKRADFVQNLGIRK